ncbi:hypothetical protein BH10CHL1_BH10CHL1_04770 [soil metagenome]
MITWFWIVIALIAVVILIAILLRYRRIRRNVIVKTMIDIYPSGNHHIEFTPATGIHSVDAIQLAISYLANIFCVTAKGSLALEWPILNLIYYVRQWNGKELSNPQEYRDGLDQLVIKGRVDPLKDGRFAVGDGEHYQVKLIRGIQLDYSLSKFAMYAYANNLSYSALLLYCQIAHKIDDTYLKLLHYSFVALAESFYDKKLHLSDNQMMAFISVEYILQVFTEPIRNSPERESRHRKVTELMKNTHQK